MKQAALFFALLFVYGAHAEVIKFPQEELATETVLPVFENAPVVKQRTVTTEGRFEVGGGLGFNMTEALYNKMNFFGTGSYHFNETHGVNVAFMFINDGLSDKGEQLKKGEGLNDIPFDASLAPSPESMLWASYQFTAYYGKISLTKSAVINLSIYGLAGLGMVSYGDSNNFGLNLGVGEKFYLTKNLALRLDLRLLAYRGPDPTSDKTNLNPNLNDDQRKSSDLDEATFFHSMINFGFVYLL